MTLFATKGDVELLKALSKTDVSAIGSAKNKAELWEAVSPLLGLKKFSFSFALPAFGLLFAALCAVLFSSAKNVPDWILVLSPLLSVAFFVWHFFRTGRRDNVLKAALVRAAMLNSGMEYGCGGNPRDLFAHLSRGFASFSLGDEDRKIISCATGRMDIGDGETAPFNALTFQYVVVRYSTDSKGRVRKTRETRRHYCLYLPDFKYAPPLDIRSSYGRQWPSRTRVKWTTALPAFNKKHNVRCAEMTECAKFLSPAVVLAYGNTAERLGDISMESHGNRVLFVFKYANMLELPISLKKIVNGTILLKDAMQKDLTFPNLDVMKRLVAEIKRFNDSNF